MIRSSIRLLSKQASLELGQTNGHLGSKASRGGSPLFLRPQQWVGAKGEQCSTAIGWGWSSQAGAGSGAGLREMGAGNVHIYIDKGRKWL